MGLLFDAAVAWNNLHDTTYYLLLGRKKQWSSSLLLDFRSEDFPHLAGVQYATDVDFGISRAEIHSGKFISKIINGEIDSEAIEKAANWQGRIRGRLEGIIALEETLDSGFLIYRFDSHKVPSGTNIEAKYVIKNLRSGVTFFVFVDADEVRWFCRSVFRLNVADYTANQTRVAVLKKQKRISNEIVTDYINPNYQPTT